MYYTLRYQHRDKLHRAGERVAASKDMLRIGQQEDCDVRLENPTDYADELFAIIKPTADGDGWLLIPCSEYVATIVNGTPVQLMQRLSDGNRICFAEGGQELIFNILQDDKYNLDRGNVRIAAPMPRRLITALVLVPLLLIGTLGIYTYNIAHQGLKLQKLLDAVRPSIIQINIDSVYYCRIEGADTTKLMGYSYTSYEGHAVSGTAFLTTDGLLVTARHCIEPWLNSREAQEQPFDDICSQPVQWAMLAETYNQTHGADTLYKVVSVCELSNGEKLLSTDFAYCTDNDDIIELGDFNNELYWRSIARRHARTDMMLGDVATCTFADKGDIILADTSNIAALVQEGREIYFMGYPNFNEKGLSQSEGKVRLQFSADRVISHDGNLIQGYSGGPALMTDGGRVYAVGVISVTDNTGGNRMYSVPVTAIKNQRSAAEGNFKGGEQ